MTMAAPFTPFYENGTVNTAAILPLAKVFKQRLGITAVWVMGMRGQFDTMDVAERKLVAAAWVAAGACACPDGTHPLVFLVNSRTLLNSSVHPTDDAQTNIQQSIFLKSVSLYADVHKL